MRRYLDAGVPVGEHLADQLLLPMALGTGGSFRTLEPSLHCQDSARALEAVHQAGSPPLEEPGRVAHRSAGRRLEAGGVKD